MVPFPLPCLITRGYHPFASDIWHGQFLSPAEWGQIESLLGHENSIRIIHFYVSSVCSSQGNRKASETWNSQNYKSKMESEADVGWIPWKIIFRGFVAVVQLLDLAESVAYRGMAWWSPTYIRDLWMFIPPERFYPLVIQHSYWKWPFIGDCPIQNGSFP